jgi:hypothetical protein
MTNVLQTGAQWLGGVLTSHASESITYHRGDQQVALSASLGRSEWEVTDFEGTRTEHTDVDFILGDAAALKLDMGITLPVRGDRIKWIQGSVVQVYEVMAPNGEQPYRLDPTETILRIHAKRIGTE